MFLHSTSGNFDEVDESGLTFEENILQTQNEELIEIDDQNTIIIPSPCTPKNAGSKRKTKDSITPFQTKLIALLEETQFADSDKQFLLSLLPDYKQLNDSQKLDFRLNCLNFFKNVQQSNIISFSNVPNLHQTNNFSQYPSAFRLLSQNNNPHHLTFRPQYSQSNMYIPPLSFHPPAHQPSYPLTLYPQSSCSQCPTGVNSYSSPNQPAPIVTDIPSTVQCLSPTNQ